MALINCPACNKKISSRAKTCSHCNTQLEILDDEDQQRIIDRQRWKKRRRYQYVSFATLIAFMIGAMFFWQGMENPEHWYNFAGKGLLALGFAGYVFSRIVQIFNK